MSRIATFGGLRRTLALTAILVGTMFPAIANAADWTFDGHVTDLESTYVPTEVPFYSDGGTSACPAGTMLHYLPQGADQESKLANIQANLSILATALASGKKVRLFGNNGSCTILFVHILAN